MKFDFDDIQEWGPRLTWALRDVVPESLREQVGGGTSVYLEDALDAVIAGSDETQLVEVTRSWLRGQQVIGYHGSRLSVAEIASVHADGVHALIPWRRQKRLETILSSHPGWEAARAVFEETLADFANGRFGCREGQAHLTLSRGALLTAFNHYLIEGSEFDAAVAVKLLGEDALQLLQQGRSPVLFTVAVPGPIAIEVSERRAMPGEMSGTVRHVLQFWAHWMQEPELDPGTQHLDYGLLFYEGIPASWMTGSSIIDEATLLPFYHR